MIDLADLTADGDTVDLADGRTLRLRIETDMDTTINDSDTYGKSERYCHDYWRDGRTLRPDDFTGNAEKVQVDRGDWIWWEPPADGPKRGTPEFRKFRSLVADLLSRGFYVVTLELCAGIDAYNWRIVVDVASLGGVDSVDGENLAFVLPDLLSELRGIA